MTSSDVTLLKQELEVILLFRQSFPNGIPQRSVFIDNQERADTTFVDAYYGMWCDEDMHG